MNLLKERVHNSRKNTLFVSASVSTVSCFSLRTCSGTNCGRRSALPTSIHISIAKIISHYALQKQNSKMLKGTKLLEEI
jgi:hypothetical protein